MKMLVTADHGSWVRVEGPHDQIVAFLGWCVRNHVLAQHASGSGPSKTPEHWVSVGFYSPEDATKVAEYVFERNESVDR